MKLKTSSIRDEGGRWNAASRARSEAVCRCNPVQGATATLAFTAILAMWNLQLAESKGGTRVRILLSPPKFDVQIQ